jgi:hypothetical protein
MKNKGPIVSKDARFPFQVAVTAWIDLLGYGGMIASADFNPLHPKAKEALDRLRSFHQIVADHSTRHFPTLVMNDGAVAYRDLSFRSKSNTFDFLSRAWRLFQEINATESAHGMPGARLVLASGFRVLGRRAGIDATHLRSIISRAKAGELGIEEAVREAARITPKFDIVPQLQANFAFTKAYVAEASGSAGGLPGPNFYVDLSLFDGTPSGWIELGPPIHWSGRLSLACDYAQILELEALGLPAGGPSDIRDGLQVAQHLAHDPNVLDALRVARK